MDRAGQHDAPTQRLAAVELVGAPTVSRAGDEPTATVPALVRGSTAEPIVGEAVPTPSAPEAGMSVVRTTLGAAGSVVALVSAQVVMALALIVIAGRTETVQFGSWIALYTAAIAVGALADFGSSTLWTRELARGVGRDTFISRLIRRSAWQSIAVVLVAVGGLLLSRDHLPTLAVLALAAQALTFSLANGMLAAVRAVRSPPLATWCNVAGNVALLGAVVVTPTGILLTVAAIAASSSWLISAGLGWLLVRRAVARTEHRPVPPAVRNPWRGSYSFGISNVASALQLFLVPIVGLAAGEREAAVLGAVNKWAQPVTLLAMAYASYMFPKLAKAPSDRTATRHVRSMVVFVAGGTFGSLLIMLLAPWLIGTFLPDDYLDGIWVLRFYALAAIPVLVGQPLVALLEARHRERFTGRLMFTSGVASFVVAAALSVWWGAVAVPIVLGASSTAIAVLAALRVVRMWHEHGSPSLARLEHLTEPRALRTLATLHHTR